MLINGEAFDLHASVDKLTYDDIVRLSGKDEGGNYTIKYQTYGRKGYRGKLTKDHIVFVVEKMVFTVN